MTVAEPAADRPAESPPTGGGPGGAAPGDAPPDAAGAGPQVAPDEVAQDAAEAVAPEMRLLGPLDSDWLATSLTPLPAALIRNWAAATEALTRYTSDVARLATTAFADTNQPPVAEPDPSDKRFRDPAWQRDPYFRMLGQGYLRWARLMDDLVDAAALEGLTGERARFAARAVVDACAPTNFLWGNPEAQRRAMETQGQSIVDGLKNFVDDLEHNGGRPRQVDTSPFRLGENLASTPGRVVHRNPLMELIQYAPQTDTVHEIPLLVCPPWINKYYILDLSPGRSFIEWAVQHGHTVFAISYRNPDSTMAGWRLDDYLLHGPRAALEVIEDVTGSREVSIAALCVGGTLTAMLMAWLAEGGEQRVRSATLLNTLLDFEDPGALGMFTDPASVEGLVEQMQNTGYLDAASMAGTFDVLRANDLIWNYVARNWLLGESPPAFDILTWNSDATRLPRALHQFYLRACYIENQLARGVMELAGRPVRLDHVTSDTFVVAAQNDHIVPWRSAYRATQLLAGDVEFVLTSAGHIAGVVNPPSPRSRHWVGTQQPASADEWLCLAEQRHGSWWQTWADWAADRAGPRRPPPPLGSPNYPAGAAAPGAYVHDKS
jgi:polyhydroxyalkanoate synthase